jgi:threonylcarbamoyladenosine tRNA methylthiotransferase MtaB
VTLYTEYEQQACLFIHFPASFPFLNSTPIKMKTSPTYLVNVLGCKVNQYDAQQIEQLLKNYGLIPAKKTQEPQLIIIHTCGVTSAAAQKSRQTIRRLQRQHPLSQLIVTGCAASDELTQIDHAPHARIPAGLDWLQHLAEYLDQLNLPRTHLAVDIQTDAFPVTHFGDHTRAFLKVQDGCDIGCTYCIVPQLRKAPRDKSIADAVAEATQLVTKGYREIVVTGVSVGLYGRNTGHSLAELLQQLIQIPNIGRIRLSSLHPGELTDELLTVWASSPHIMPHLHLSLQSGANPILRAMHRGYTTGEYFAAVTRARAVLDHPAFTTDLIVGFPGETDADFATTYAFCQQVGFSQMHIFTYSPRPHTHAATLPHPVNGALATERSNQLKALGKKLALAYHQQFENKPIEVLVERTKNGMAQGYSRHYIPVHFPSTTHRKGEIVQLRAIQATTKGLVGTI